MDNEQKAILSALLDRYERSVRFTESRTVSRKVAINLCNDGKNDFPAYNIESFDAHLAYNRAVEELSQAGLVGYDWMKGQRGHLISRVWLNTEQLQQAYQRVNREPKADRLNAVEAILNEALALAVEEWQRSYLGDCLALVHGRKSHTQWLPQELDEAKELTAVLLAASTTSKDEVLERVFSTRVLGSSKRFETKYRTWLVKIVRRYLLEGIDGIADDEVLAQVGIIRYPEKLSFCGGLAAEFDGGRVNFAPVPSGVSVDIVALLGAILTVSATKLLLIENKANYTSYIAHHRANDELVIYHGGCYSPMKGRMLQKLAAAIGDDTAVQHWGDIDWGGFAMLLRLRHNIFPSLTPYRMDVAELASYVEATLPITDNSYCQRLQRLLDYELLHDCHPCIAYMVKNRVRLEQEAML